MAKTKLTIIGLHKQMTAEEVKRKMSILQERPESDFDDLCHALFRSKKPYVLLEKADEQRVDVLIATLTKIGFHCKGGNAEMGMSLMPVQRSPESEIICPACDKESGDLDSCQHCGIVIAKFIQHKQFDKELKRQLDTSSSSQAQWENSQEEKLTKQKRLAQERKKKAKTSEKSNGNTSDVESGEKNHAANAKPYVTVATQERKFHSVYAAIASICILLSGGVYYMHTNTNYGNDEIKLTNALAVSSSDKSSVPMDSVDTSSNDIEVTPPTIFDEKISHNGKVKILKNKLDNLIGNQMVFTAAALVTSQDTRRDQVFAKQELMRLGGLKQDTAEELQKSAVMAAELESDVDRIDALLNQFSLYTHFEFNDDAASTYDQIEAIARNVERAEHKILVETALAEHHVEHENLEQARIRYQTAKEQASELAESFMTDAALAYIASSEAAHGLVNDTELSIDSIGNLVTLEQPNLQNYALDAQLRQQHIPLMSAANPEGNEASTDSFPAIDELIKMHEHNQRLFKAAGSLLGK